MTTNVLYLGMGFDGMTPLLLCPDLTNLYVIDLFDKTLRNVKTIDNQRKNIKRYLTDGSNKNILWWYEKKNNTIINLKEKCKIISEKSKTFTYEIDSYNRTYVKKYYELIFEYCGKTRTTKTYIFHKGIHPIKYKN
jgi:hypothetical protein